MTRFTTSLRGNKLEISNFVLGSSPYLQRIGIVSTCDEPQLVSFRSSDLGDMVSFQSDNPNSSAGPNSSGIPDNPEPLPEYCNEMFNLINMIESVLLPPGETVYVVLQFAPLRGDPALLDERRKEGNRAGMSSRRDENKQQDRFFSVRGRVQMIAEGKGDAAPSVLFLRCVPRPYIRR